MSKRKITYLLGAGASYGALPVVNTMNDRILVFLKELYRLSQYDKDAGSGLSHILAAFNEVFENVRKHTSIDTYAKKLYFKDDLNNLAILKALMTAYFEYEQTPYNKYRIDSGLITTLKNNNAVGDDINHDLRISHLDKRYDAFLATVLAKERKKFLIPHHINIISWNYDSQIELAFSGFSDEPLDHCREDLNVYPFSSWTADLSSRPNHIIKLNGTAGLHYRGGHILSLSERTGNRLFDYLNFLKKDSKFDNILNRSMISFAWEENEIKQKALKTAKTIIKNTDDLVVIGYSFPYFNRDIDDQLFDSTVIDRIWINCPSNDYEVLEQVVSSFVRCNEINPSYDLTQFYIPRPKKTSKYAKENINPEH